MFDFLMGAQGVQVPDPIKSAQSFMSLAQAADARRMQQYALQKAQREDEAATALGQAIPGLDINDDNKVAAVLAAAPPDARAKIAQYVVEQRKAAAEAGYKKSESAAKDWEVKGKQAQLVGNVAQGLLQVSQSGQPIEPYVASAAKLLQSNGLDPQQIIPPQGADPVSHWKAVASQAISANDQIQAQLTAARDANTNTYRQGELGQQAANLEQAKVRDANMAAYQRGELGVRNAELANSNLRARAAMLTADPFNLNGLNPSGGAGGGGGGDADLMRAATADAAKNGQPTFIVGGKTYNTADAQQGTPLQRAMQSGLSGDEFLKTLPPQVAGIVKQMVDGRQQPPAGAALRSPQIQQLLMLANQYDPTFDAANWGMRYKTAQDFAPQGKSGQNITALNTAMGHTLGLKQAMDKLGNFGGIGTPLNAPINAIEAFTGDPRQTDVSMHANAVAGELAKVFRSTGMSEADIQSWKNQLGMNMSPDQQTQMVRSAMDLINSRLQAIGDAYGRGMGKASDGMSLLSPEARAAYEELSGGKKPPAEAPKPGTKAAPKAAQSTFVDSLPDPASVPPGTRIRNTKTGEIMTSDGKVWR